MSAAEQRAEFLRTWKLFAQPGDVLELRAPKAGRFKTISGYFDNPKDFAKAAAEWDGQANLYVTINAVTPALLARSANRAQAYAETTTSDADIPRRRYILVDFDAKRPANISASDAEWMAAAQRTTECRAWLCSQYGVDAVQADSGNGGHLLIPVDLPNNEAALTLVQNFLRALSLQFEDESVKIDQTTANAARITKIYGSLAVKGSDIPDRPHRHSRLLYVPDTITPVPIETLQQIVALLPPEPEKENTTNGRRPFFSSSEPKPLDVPDFIVRHSLQVRREAPYQDGRKWVLSVCPFNSDHTDNSAVIVQRGSGRVGFRCHHDSCLGRDWQALRDLLEPDRSRRRDERNEFYEKTSSTQAHARRQEPHSDSSAYEKNEFNELCPDAPPPQMDPAAYHGPLGRLVRLIEPETEADPAAILVQMLVGFGNLIGRRVYQTVGATRHYTNLYAVIVGRTSRGRKGTGFGYVRQAMEYIERDWAERRIMSGLSSGEGVVYQIRDAVEKTVTDKKTGATKQELVDEGALDKRLLVVEEEMARSLKVLEREGCTLSPILRQGWDNGNLRVLTKNPMNATDGHLSVIGHITQEELTRYLTGTEQANGFANRFIYVYSSRQRLLPEGGRLPMEQMQPIYEELKTAADFAGTVDRLHRSEEVRDLWAAVYPALSAETPGLLGAVTSRSEAQVLRVSGLYALADGSDVIEREHLEAALAVWEYSEATCRLVFGDATGDPTADAILKELRRSPEGMDRTNLMKLFSNNLPSARLSAALHTLLKAGRATCASEPGENGGRPREVWHAVRRGN